MENTLSSDWRVRWAMKFFRFTGRADLVVLLEAVLSALTPRYFEISGSDYVKPVRIPQSLLNALHKGPAAEDLCRRQRQLALVPLADRDA